MGTSAFDKLWDSAGPRPVPAQRPPVVAPDPRQLFYAEAPPVMPGRQTYAPRSALLAPVVTSAPAPAAAGGDAVDALWDHSPAEQPAAPRSTLHNALNTVNDALTMGMGSKFDAAVAAADDAIHGRDSFGHSFTKNLDAEHAGLQDFRAKNPYGAATLGAVGSAGQIALAGPLIATGEIANGLSLGARTAAAARTGGALGAVNALGNAPNRGGLVDNALLAAKGGVLGATIGAAAVPVTQAVGSVAGRVGPATQRLVQRAVPANALSAPATTGQIGPVAAEIAGNAPNAPQPEVDRATQILLRRVQRAGFTPQEMMDRLEQIPADKPVSIMEVAGDQSHPLRQLGKWVARTPSTGASQLRSAIADRMTPLPNAQRVLGDVSEAMGQGRVNLLDNADALKGQQLAKAQPFYDAAFGPSTPPVPLSSQVDENSPTLGDLMKRPSIKSAIKFHNDIAAERGEQPLALPTEADPNAVEGVPPGFSADQWEQAKSAMKQRGVPIPNAFGGRASIRDANGRLRPDLGPVSFDDLQTEWQRMAELNAQEEAHHAGVQEAGYRADYDALPRTEKFGVKGKEDLPDADGTVDPERLTADNKIVTNYNRSLVVRAARQKAMDRIQGEMNARPWNDGQDDTSFDFGANAASPGSAPSGIPLKSLQKIKFKLDDALGFAKRNGQLPDGTPATNAKLGAINDTRKALLDIMTAHSPDYAQGNSIWAGDATEQEAGEQGKQFLSRPIDELQRSFPAMTRGEVIQHHTNAVSGPLRDRIFNTSAVDRAKIFSNPDIQERLQTVISEPRMATLAKKLGYEHQIALTNQGVTGGSDTAENLANDADVSGAPMKSLISGVAMGRPRRILTGVVRSVVNPAVDAWVRGINEQTANALAPKLTAGMNGRPELNNFMDDLATAFDRMQRSRGSLPYAGSAAGTATSALLSRQK